MKRIHIHVGVDDLNEGIEFYSALFGSQPTKLRDDYAKWLLEDPKLNFAISTRADRKGLDHFGIQAEEDSELDDLRARMRSAKMPLYDEGEVVCCYSHSDKSWVQDPAGIAWETYKTMKDAKVYSRSLTKEGDECCADPLNGESTETVETAGQNCCA